MKLFRGKATTLLFCTVVAMIVQLVSGLNFIATDTVLFAASFLPANYSLAMSLNINTVNSRLVYGNARDMLKEAGVSVENAKLTQSFLRLENQLVINKTQFLFPVLVNQNNQSGTIFNTEQRLNQQDSFVSSAWGVFLSNPTSNVDATAKLCSYPDAIVFTAASAAAAETIYNSYFQLAVNNDIILPAWDCGRHRFAPQTQQTAAFGAGSPIDQLDGSADGYYPVEPNIVFIGSKNSVLNLIMPAALAAVDAFERISVIFRGVLAQNSTIIT